MADDDYEDYETPEEPNPRDLRQQLKAANARAREADLLKQENERLKQDLVISGAGITLNDLQRTALSATHSGDWNAEAVKKTAEALGFVQPPPPPPPVVDDPSLAQQDALAAASAGTDAPPASRDAEIDALLAKATTEAEFLSIYRASGRPVAQ